jgi:outer membrane lipoprotein-sorting protein
VQTAFTKTTNKGHEAEHIEGTLYFEIDHGIVIYVTAPVRQWLVSQKNTLLIYYPDDKYAFRFPMQHTATFSFFQAFLGATSEDFGLSQLGFSLDNNTVRNDTLITVWSPPEHTTGETGAFILKHVGDRIVYAELRNADGTTVSSSCFSSHLKYKTYYFPCDIASYRYNNSDVRAYRLH